MPINAKLDFYLKVVLPSITYGILIWGSCGKTLFDELERIHVRSAKVIFGLDWYTSGKDVLAKVKWFTLNSMFKQQLLYLAYKNYYNLIPATLQSLFIKTGHRYELRDRAIFTKRQGRWKSQISRKKTSCPSFYQMKKMYCPAI